MNLNEKFMEAISNIKDPVTFLGVAKLLGAPLINPETSKVREFTDIFADAMEFYDKKPRKFKRDLLKIVVKANRTKGGNTNGNPTSDSESTDTLSD